MTQIPTATKHATEPNLPTNSPRDLLHSVFRRSGFAVNIEDAAEGMKLVTVHEAEKRADGTIGPVLRFTVGADDKIVRWENL